MREQDLRQQQYLQEAQQQQQSPQSGGLMNGLNGLMNLLFLGLILKDLPAGLKAGKNMGVGVINKLKKLYAEKGG
jgi:hypothetical protein